MMIELQAIRKRIGKTKNRNLNGLMGIDYPITLTTCVDV
jgi:hypothetical protein